MNWSNLKIAYRSILKTKIETSICILGLGIGLGCIILLTALVIHEYSFNRDIPNHELGYRVLQNDDCRTSYPLAPAINSQIPGIKNYFRFFQTNSVLLKGSDNQVLEERRFAFADVSVFDCLGVDFQYGVPAQSNSEIAISVRMAKKYFNTKNVLGENFQVKLKNEFIYLTVSGVYSDFPSNYTLNPNFIANIDLSGEIIGQSAKMFGQYGTDGDVYKNWENKDFSSYIFLEPSANPIEVSTKINDLNKQNKSAEKELLYLLQPVNQVYLNSGNLSGNFFSRAGNANELKYYVAIALVILCIAIVNYVFLTKAKLLSRYREMGTKKALGATKGILRKQVLVESNLISILSVFPALAIILIGIPFVNSTLGKSLGFEVFNMWQTWVFIFLIILLTGTLSGLFIGNNISGKSIVPLLSGQISQKSNSYNLNNSFLSFHFAIFIVLIISVFVFKKQIDYSLNNFKAINPDNILVCELNTLELQNQFQVLQNELLKIPGVIKIAGSSFVPPFNSFLPVRLKTDEQEVRFDGLIMGSGMTDLLEMEFVDGKPFGDFPEGRTDVIFNESAAVRYGIKVGEPFNGFNVQGIVKDFNAHSLHRLIEPMVILQQHPQKMRLLVVKTNGIHNQLIIREMNKMAKDISPEALVNITLLTDRINHFYIREQNQAKLITAFSMFAIVLAVTGLLGIVLITISKRTKEIGIRKVNGAKVSEVLLLLNKDFVKWVVVAFVIACPIAYFVMQKWLENFAYRTDLSWWIFVFAGILALFIALITVSFQSWKAATRNPITSLRYE